MPDLEEPKDRAEEPDLLVLGAPEPELQRGLQIKTAKFKKYSFGT